MLDPALTFARLRFSRPPNAPVEVVADVRDGGRDVGRTAASRAVPAYVLAIAMAGSSKGARELGRDPGLDPGRDPGRDPGLEPGLLVEPGREPGRELGRDRDRGRSLGWRKFSGRQNWGEVLSAQVSTTCVLKFRMRRVKCRHPYQRDDTGREPGRLEAPVSGRLRSRS